MQSFQDFLNELQTGSSRLGATRPPQALIEFLIEQLETQTRVLGGSPIRQELAEFVGRIMRKAKPCYSSVVVAMFYLDGMWKKLSLGSSSSSKSGSELGKSGKPEVLAAFILADKYLYDIALANCEWVKVSGIHSLSQVNAFEREFFGVLEYNIQFSEDAFRDFVSFLDISLTIRQHQLQASTEFPLTFSHLCSLQSKSCCSDHAHHSVAVVTPRPQEATLITLRLMLLCCISCCATAISATVAACQQAKAAEVALKKQEALLPKGLKQTKLIKSDSWSGSTDNLVLSAIPKNRSRKFSDTMIGEQTPWYRSLMGKIRS